MMHALTGVNALLKMFYTTKEIIGNCPKMNRLGFALFATYFLVRLKLIKLDFPKEAAMIRISGGICKGRKIKTLDTMSTRPTLSRVKTSLFDILSDRISDAVILDLYSGTGNIGIEALSRGAKSVVFVENNGAQVRLIKENLTTTNLLEAAEIITLDVFEAIQRLNKRMIFDIIYLAPPFLKGLVRPTIEAISKTNLLSPCGLLGVEHHKKETVLSLAQGFSAADTLTLSKQRRFGDIVISFYEITQLV
jgi:16S rRNA (guanine(966)-N(2))-methyltransferase RsmD